MKSFCTLSNGNRKHFYVCLINTIKTVLINTTGTDMRRFLVYFFSSYFGVVQLTKNSLISGDRHNAGWNQRWYLVRDRCRCVDKSDTSRRHYDTDVEWRRVTSALGGDVPLSQIRCPDYLTVLQATRQPICISTNSPHFEELMDFFM